MYINLSITENIVEMETTLSAIDIDSRSTSQILQVNKDIVSACICKYQVHDLRQRLACSYLKAVGDTVSGISYSTSIKQSIILTERVNTITR